MTLSLKRLSKFQGRYKSTMLHWRRTMPNTLTLVMIFVVGLTGVALGLIVVGATIQPINIMLLLMIVAISPFVALIVGDVRKLLLTVVLFDIPFQLDVHLFYRVDLEQYNAISGLGISATTIALIGLYLLWMMQLLDKRSPTASVSSWTRVSVTLIAYISAVGISAIVAQDLLLSFFELFMLIQTFFVYIYLISTIRTRDEFVYTIMVVLVTLLLHSLVMIGLRIIGHSIPLGPMSARVDTNDVRGLRVGGIIGSPNTAAGYLSLVLAPTCSVLFTRISTRYKLLAGCTFGAGVLALVFTGSRGGLIAFTASMILFLFFGWRRGWLSLAGPLLMLSGVLIVSLFFQNAILSRVFADDSGAAEGRVPLVRIALDIIWRHPIFGVGANNFALALEQYQTPEFGRAWFNIVHNKYLLVLAEAGPLGLITFVSFLIATLSLGIHSSRSSDPVLAPIALGLTAGMFGQMTHMLFDLFSARPLVQMLWIVAALITIIHLYSNTTMKYEITH